MKQYFLGIDTSCYTTSCAIVDSDGEVVGEARRILSVKDGDRGLRQSEMVYQHNRNLPVLMQELPPVPITGIGVSGFPRRLEDSFMPAFTVGLGYAQGLVHFLGVPLHVFSHQENHILAAFRVNRWTSIEPFLNLHLSGGTTELLYGTMEDGDFHLETIGGSKDLQGGQMVDRIGVKLGLHFPAGAALDTLAQQAETYEPLPTSVVDGWISFGGPCSEAMRRLEREPLPYAESFQSSMALATFNCISRSLEKLFDYHLDKHDVRHIIAVGGVMSNSIIRERLTTHMRRKGISFHIVPPQYSVDNSTGNAYGAYLQSLRK